MCECVWSAEGGLSPLQPSLSFFLFRIMDTLNVWQYTAGLDHTLRDTPQSCTHRHIHRQAHGVRTGVISWYGGVRVSEVCVCMCVCMCVWYLECGELFPQFSILPQLLLQQHLYIITHIALHTYSYIHIMSCTIKDTASLPSESLAPASVVRVVLWSDLCEV
jgi:hypothetical protein